MDWIEWPASSDYAHTIPRPYITSGYYIDHRPYGLAPPPYGHRWVRVDRDLLLIHLASAAVIDILYDFSY